VTGPELLDENGLGLRLDRFRQRLFRWESLPEYQVDSDGDDYRRWLAGDPDPLSDRKRRWLATLGRERAEGRVSTRVRVLSEQLTDYERYSCEFGYALNAAAGEDIRVLRRGEHRIPDEFVDRDFWLVDADEVVEMHYDRHGRFLGAEVKAAVELDSYLHLRDLAWEAAEPFVPWWARHPELHRKLVP
jgi:hypothetical protein